MKSNFQPALNLTPTKYDRYRNGHAMKCVYHGMVESIWGHTMEGHDTLRCPACLENGKITDVIFEYSRSN